MKAIKITLDDFSKPTLENIQEITVQKEQPPKRVKGSPPVSTTTNPTSPNSIILVLKTNQGDLETTLQWQQYQLLEKSPKDGNMFITTGILKDIIPGFGVAGGA